jgi:ribosomal protein S18 acetylase RimI-like enzyme
MIRPAQPTDVSEIINLTRLAADGLVEFLFNDFTIQATQEEVLKEGVLAEVGVLSYRHTDVAVYEDKVVGIATSYPASQHQITAEMKQFFAAERLGVLEDFYQSRVEGSWYLDTLGVKPEFQHQGIGKKLLQATKEKAKKQQYQQLSLMVFTHNIKALNLYQSQGFKQVKLIQIGNHPELSHQKSSLLMQCDLV